MPRVKPGSGKLNRVHRWDGPVFRGRFKNQLIGSEEQLRLVLAYIHPNPLRANPARRFAVWALFHGAQCTYREIAGRLGVPHSQVAKLLSRLRHGQIRDPLKGWMDSWLAG